MLGGILPLMFEKNGNLKNLTNFNHEDYTWSIDRKIKI